MFRFLLLALAALCGCSVATSRGTLYQIATIHALSAGAYEAQGTCGDLRRHGDSGLGTFEGLDGELVFLNGTCFQIRADGTVLQRSDDARVPFASVTFLDGAASSPLPPNLALSGLEATLLARATMPETPYAILVEGTFRSLRIRSVPKQSRPYPKLAAVIAQQTIFELRPTRATLVGFWIPKHLGGLAPPGLHLHVLTADWKSGGHVLAADLAQGTAVFEPLRELTVRLPQGDALGHFERASPSGGVQE
jgi:acetolactate decarboxylase